MQATRQSEADNGDWSNWGNPKTAKDFYDLYYKNYLNVVSENYYDGKYSSTLYLVLFFLLLSAKYATIFV